MIKQFTYEPLDSKTSLKDVVRFAKSRKLSFDTATEDIFNIPLIVAILLLSLLFILERIFGLGYFIISLLITGSILLLLSIRGNRKSYKVYLFAVNNGLIYKKYNKVPYFRGFYSRGLYKPIQIDDVVMGKIGDFNFWFGNCIYYKIGSIYTGKMAVASINLKGFIPSVYICTKNKIFNNSKFNNTQKISLEGNFDSYFSVYTLEENKRDVLEFFNTRHNGKLC